MQYTLTDEEARRMVEGYGHPEVDNAPDTLLATGEVPAVGDPRVFLGTHNLLRDECVVACWNCEQAWDPQLAREECPGDSPLVNAPPLGNIQAPPQTVGRNSPCPCGSGRKFKRCHGLK